MRERLRDSTKCYHWTPSKCDPASSALTEATDLKHWSRASAQIQSLVDEQSANFATIPPPPLLPDALLAALGRAWAGPRSRSPRPCHVPFRSLLRERRIYHWTPYNSAFSLIPCQTKFKFLSGYLLEWHIGKIKPNLICALKHTCRWNLTGLKWFLR